MITLYLNFTGVQDYRTAWNILDSTVYVSVFKAELSVASVLLNSKDRRVHQWKPTYLFWHLASFDSDRKIVRWNWQWLFLLQTPQNREPQFCEYYLLWVTSELLATYHGSYVTMLWVVYSDWRLPLGWEHRQQQQTSRGGTQTGSKTFKAVAKARLLQDLRR